VGPTNSGDSLLCFAFFASSRDFHFGFFCIARVSWVLRSFLASFFSPSSRLARRLPITSQSLNASSLRAPRRSDEQHKPSRKMLRPKLENQTHES
jgi:hypothetical protein